MAMRTGIDDTAALLDELCRCDFVSFATRAFPYIHGGGDPSLSWHIEAIAFQLERISKGESRRLLIEMPPRNLKTFLTSIAWVAYQLGQDPRLNFVCVSYAKELSAKFARQCRDIMQSAWYRKLFPRTVIRHDRRAVDDFETTAGGGRLATSVNGTLTGRGGDIIIIDDPIKPDEAFSDTIREGTNEWFKTTLASRLNNKQTGAIIVVMQRTHEYDLAGMLYETNDWDRLSLSAIAEEDAVIPLTRNRVHFRKAGDVLNSAHEPLSALMKIKREIGSSLYEAHYQQRPVPAGGNMIRSLWLENTYRLQPERQDGDVIVQSYDTASTEGLTSDHSVGITVLLRKNIAYVLDVWRKRVDFVDLKRHVIDSAREWKANVLLIEKAASGEQLIQVLRREEPSGVPLPTARKPDGDKKTRLAGVTPMIEAGALVLPHEAPYLAVFKRELLAFPSTRHDDQVDALSQLFIWMRDRDQSNYFDSIAGPICFYEDEYGCFRTSEDDDERARNYVYDGRSGPDPRYYMWDETGTRLVPRYSQYGDDFFGPICC